jgi:hypothetical protein
MRDAARVWLQSTAGQASSGTRYSDGLSSSAQSRYPWSMNPAESPHRKRVKHYDEPGHLHELTFSCFQRRPLLTNHQWRCMLSECIERATERHGYTLHAFVFMPEHVHLLVLPGAGCLWN